MSKGVAAGIVGRHSRGRSNDVRKRVRGRRKVSGPSIVPPGVVKAPTCLIGGWMLVGVMGGVALW